MSTDPKLGGPRPDAPDSSFNDDQIAARLKAEEAARRRAAVDRTAQEAPRDLLVRAERVNEAAAFLPARDDDQARRAEQAARRAGRDGDAAATASQTIAERSRPDDLERAEQRLGKLAAAMVELEARLGAPGAGGERMPREAGGRGASGTGSFGRGSVGSGSSGGGSVAAGSSGLGSVGSEFSGRGSVGSGFSGRGLPLSDASGRGSVASGSPGRGSVASDFSGRGSLTSEPSGLGSLAPDTPGRGSPLPGVSGRKLPPSDAASRGPGLPEASGRGLPSSDAVGRGLLSLGGALSASELQMRAGLQELLAGGAGLTLLRDPRATFRRLFDRIKRWPRRLPPGRRPESDEDFDALFQWVFAAPEPPEPEPEPEPPPPELAP